MLFNRPMEVHRTGGGPTSTEVQDLSENGGKAMTHRPEIPTAGGMSESRPPGVAGVDDFQRQRQALLNEMEALYRRGLPIERSMRHRVQIARGMKGAISFEATVDGTGYTQEEVLIESARLVSALELRYPAPEA